MGRFTDVVAGGLSGFAVGGPWGAAAGAAGGLFGQNDARQEQGVDLRALTPEQQARISGSSTAIQGLIARLQRGNDPAAMRELQAALYAPAARGINDTYTRAGSRQEASSRLSGTGPSSRAVEGQRRLLSGRGAALTDASNQAVTGAYGLQAQQQAGIVDQIGGLQGVINSTEGTRLASSTRFGREPGAGANSAFGAMGNAITNDESWLRNGGFNDMFGG